MTLIDQYASEIKKLCAACRVKTLYAFGSVLTKEFDNRCDVDFIVDFEP